MVVVTGTKRSGTSLWMQILGAAGLSRIGNAFPHDWETRLGHLNPQGFYESRYRSGINFLNNPHPITGDYLMPRETARQAIKIFIPGLLRTELVYLDRVIATMRDWRSYCLSRARLEHAERNENAPDPEANDDDDRRFHPGYHLPAHLEWWLENYALLRDVMVRQYPFHLTTYERVTRAPEQELPWLFEWIGTGDWVSAISVVQRPRRREDAEIEHDLDRDQIEVFDEVYRLADEGEPFSDAFLQRMDDMHAVLLPRIRRYVDESILFRARNIASAAANAVNTDVTERPS